MPSSLLLGTLPEAVYVGGKVYPLNTDFRVWVQFESILLYEEGSFLSKLPKLLKLCYVRLPATLSDAVSGMVSFYTGREIAKSISPETVKNQKPLYSFCQDADLIYAGFYQQYGINLSTAALHWFQFKALLMGLGEDTRFMKVLGYRGMDVSSLKSKEEKKFYRKMKKLYDLRDYRTEEEKDFALAQSLGNLF